MQSLIYDLETLTDTLKVWQEQDLPDEDSFSKVITTCKAFIRACKDLHRDLPGQFISWHVLCEQYDGLDGFTLRNNAHLMGILSSFGLIIAGRGAERVFAVERTYLGVSLAVLKLITKHCFERVKPESSQACEASPPATALQGSAVLNIGVSGEQTNKHRANICEYYSICFEVRMI